MPAQGCSPEQPSAAAGIPSAHTSPGTLALLTEDSAPGAGIQHCAPVTHRPLSTHTPADFRPRLAWGPFIRRSNTHQHAAQPTHRDGARAGKPELQTNAQSPPSLLHFSSRLRGFAASRETNCLHRTLMVMPTTQSKTVAARTRDAKTPHTRGLLSAARLWDRSCASSSCPVRGSKQPRIIRTARSVRSHQQAARRRLQIEDNVPLPSRH